MGHYGWLGSADFWDFGQADGFWIWVGGVDNCACIAFVFGRRKYPFVMI